MMSVCALGDVMGVIATTKQGKYTIAMLEKVKIWMNVHWDMIIFTELNTNTWRRKERMNVSALYTVWGEKPI